ncbi:S8 family serine peptidase [Paenibacillus sp. GP183]|uniref:S8 family serine peptidase n=1 Tax=Paenibacillus sp. GP183 TaxID=1882751 RepID=UPI00089C79E5|nr:S8 family serine peptidase [Paenibacillus sp. GP183]SEC09451.1 Serine protease, subtilisin family [Paenibacillus sp. GP183]
MRKMIGPGIIFLFAIFSFIFVKYANTPLPSQITNTNMIKTEKSFPNSNTFWGLDYSMSPLVPITLSKKQIVPTPTEEPGIPEVQRMGKLQYYLQQIHTEAAWETVKDISAPPLVIAFVDTGVDFHHPDLKDYLLQGVNLLDPLSPPDDDNGHGTNVAGILKAVSDNSKMKTRTLLMPIKALERNGKGTEDKLSSAIRYAVDHSAKIIVLSVGLNRNSSKIIDAVQYAENHDVLLVAATGNHGTSIEYPAAYSTVLAVGGSSTEDLAKVKSNWGPEIDVIAPWYVYTALKGGGYGYNEGTSMAAPQVAAVAALAWLKYPYMKPYQIRNLIRQTADHISQDGWDPHSGYGLLRADKALMIPYEEDIFRNNTSKDRAAPLSISKMSSFVFHGNNPKWFYIDSTYNGTLKLKFQTESSKKSNIQLIYYQNKDQDGSATSLLGENVEFPVSKGRSFIEVQNVSDPYKTIPVQLTTEFKIYRDPFEDNDRMYKAYTLPFRNQEITGTFDHEQNQGWFMMNVEQLGILNLKVSTDTPRIDLALQIIRSNDKPIIIDKMGDGESETTSLLVSPGSYYFKISNVISEHTYPVVGEYKFQIEFTSS